MGNNNKPTKDRMIEIFGNECMIEKLGIRKIPIEHRRRIKGYKKMQDVLTYHHIVERHEGGRTTIENGAVLKGYNHEWLHKLPEAEKQKINQQIQEYKINFIAMLGTGETISKGSIDITQLDFTDPNNYITIEAQNCTKEEFEKMKKRNEAQRVEKKIEDTKSKSKSKSNRKPRPKPKKETDRSYYYNTHYTEGDELEDDWDR